MPQTNYFKSAFCYSGEMLWNSLPGCIRKSDFLGYFKGEIDQFLTAFSCAATKQSCKTL